MWALQVVRLGFSAQPQSCMCAKETCQCIDSAGEKDRLISVYKPAPVPVYTSVVVIHDDAVSPVGEVTSVAGGTSTPAAVAPTPELAESDYERLFDTAFGRCDAASEAPSPSDCPPTVSAFLVEKLARNRHRYW